MKWKTDNSVTHHKDGSITIVESYRGGRLTIQIGKEKDRKGRRKNICIVFGVATYPRITSASGHILAKILSLLNINGVHY